MPVDQIGRNALWTGALWTLVLAALAFAFKSSWNWSISLMSLVAAGLGWAALLAWSAHRERRANDMLRASIGKLAQSLRERVQVDCAELEQVDSMLGEAIEQLMTAFQGLREQGHDRRAGDIQTAVTALQFRDVVGQKLGHVREQLEALDQALRDIGDAAGVCAPQDLERRIGDLLPPLHRARESGPAQQESMRAGAVELF